MKFTFPTYKESEFQSTFHYFVQQSGHNPGQLQFDREGSTTTAHIQDDVALKLSQDELSELAAIK